MGSKLEYLQADELARQALKKYGNGSREHEAAAEKAMEAYAAWRKTDLYKAKDEVKPVRIKAGDGLTAFGSNYLARWECPKCKGNCSVLRIMPNGDIKVQCPRDGTFIHSGWGLKRKALAKDSFGRTAQWAAIVALLLKVFGGSNGETVGPNDYDLSTYRPPKRNW